MGISQAGKSIQRKVADGATSAPIFTAYPCSVGLVLSVGASGKIQYTLSPNQTVHDGTAHWRDWSRGTISESADDVPEGPVVAVRAISVSGLVTLEVVQ